LKAREREVSKTKFARYNDGVVEIYREKSRRTDFAAKENVSVFDDMDFVVKLAFEESSRREQDIDFAQQMGFSLTLKVRTRYFEKVDNKCKAVINGYLYDVSYVDKTRTEMWLYLEGVKEIDS
jgi:SPP1 family predicted phage head-tail adaptor